MKFVHVADCHIGAWRDPKMKELTHQAWLSFVQEAIAEKPDFVVLAGDFFNTALPNIDSLKIGVAGLQQFKNANIPVYAIAGSHDYSPSGKTMLDVLEQAELLIDVMRGQVKNDKLTLRWTQDPKTGVKMTGIIGKRGSLDKHYYEDLDRESLEAEEGKKIFMFHTSIAELKPKFLEKMEAYPASFLPKGCDYYAGGHVHITEDISLPGYKNIVYPGPLFPASFSELEKLACGSYCVVEDWEMTRKKLVVKKTKNITIDATNKEPTTIEEELKEQLTNIQDTIVLIRIAGEITGTPSSIDFRKLFHEAYEQGAYMVLKNTIKLTSKEYEEIQVSHNSPDRLEEELMRGTPHEDIAKKLLHTLCTEPLDGEKKYEYEKRMIEQGKKIILEES